MNRLSVAVLVLCTLYGIGLLAQPGPVRQQTDTQRRVEIDFLDSGAFDLPFPTFWNNYDPVASRTKEIRWVEDRWLLGWEPWYGCGLGTIMEGHVLLLHEGRPIFVVGPHKEDPRTMYTPGGPVFFPAGAGLYIRAGEQLALEVLARNTGNVRGGFHGNARIYTVRDKP